MSLSSKIYEDKDKNYVKPFVLCQDLRETIRELLIRINNHIGDGGNKADCIDNIKLDVNDVFGERLT